MNASQYQNGKKTFSIYAATDATFIEMDFPAGMESIPASIMKFGMTFHLLTPEYWACFHHKFHVMEQALTRGKISEAMFVEILNRISDLYNRALDLYCRDTLKEAERTTDIKEWEKSLHAPVRQPESRPDQLPAAKKSACIASSRRAAATQTALTF